MCKGTISYVNHIAMPSIVRFIYYNWGLQLSVHWSISIKSFHADTYLPVTMRVTKRKDGFVL